MYREDSLTPPGYSAQVEAAEVADVPAEAPAPESSGLLTKIGVAAALGGLAAASKWAEYKGIDHDMIAPSRWTIDSTAHPLLGYMGAWAASAAANMSPRRPLGLLKGKAAFIGATAANFAVEGAQSFTVAASQYVDFWSSRNLPETAKDYAFALAGMALFMYQNRRQEQ